MSASPRKTTSRNSNVQITRAPRTDAKVTIFKAGGDAVVSNAHAVEDDYALYYKEGVNGIIQPPYNAKNLEEMVERNNTLGPCIDAMVTNVDGTGYELERRDGDKLDKDGVDGPFLKKAKSFFDECSPMTSFKTLRMRLRREYEATGMGYMEIIRNAEDKLVFVGHLEAKMMRMARLDNAVPVETTMERDGVEVKFIRMVRRRRFVQLVGTKLIWFKEYGAQGDLNKNNGVWAEPGARLPYADRASEVLYFGLVPDINTPYHVPRWINQTPSVVSSRKAEEHNVEFFNSGGVPPYLVIVQGGELAEETVKALRDALNRNDAHSRVQIIEAFSTSGELGKDGQVQVKVERFGAERANDAMFSEFDDKCENRVRRSFRLPEILLGKTESMNFATAHASYLVAEAQVFGPEREAFDEIISNTLLPEILGNRDYLFRSKPISIIDAATQLMVIQSALATKRVDPEHVVTLLGEIGGITFKTVDTQDLEDLNTEYGTDPSGNVIPISTVRPAEQTATGANGKPPDPKQRAKKDDGVSEGLVHLLGCTLAVMQHQDVLAQAES